MRARCRGKAGKVEVSSAFALRPQAHPEADRQPLNHECILGPGSSAPVLPPHASRSQPAGSGPPARPCSLQPSSHYPPSPIVASRVLDAGHDQLSLLRRALPFSNYAEATRHRVFLPHIHETTHNCHLRIRLPLASVSQRTTPSPKTHDPMHGRRLAEVGRSKRSSRNCKGSVFKAANKSASKSTMDNATLKAEPALDGSRCSFLASPTQRGCGIASWLH